MIVLLLTSLLSFVLLIFLVFTLLLSTVKRHFVATLTILSLHSVPKLSKSMQRFTLECSSYDERRATAQRSQDPVDYVSL